MTSKEIRFDCCWVDSLLFVSIENGIGLSGFVCPNNFPNYVRLEFPWKMSFKKQGYFVILFDANVYKIQLSSIDFMSLGLALEHSWNPLDGPKLLGFQGLRPWTPLGGLQRPQAPNCYICLLYADFTFTHSQPWIRLFEFWILYLITWI